MHFYTTTNPGVFSDTLTQGGLYGWGYGFGYTATFTGMGVVTAGNQFNKYQVAQFNVFRDAAAPTSSEVTYLHTDHLGTVSIATNISGQPIARTLNLPYGGVRWSSGTMPTDWGFTGQKDNSYIKLIQMGARWYDPQIGRWVSPDTIIPDPVNPQSLNCFSFNQRDDSGAQYPHRLGLGLIEGSRMRSVDQRQQLAGADRRP